MPLARPPYLNPVLEKKAIQAPLNFMHGFRQFIGQYGIVPLAVAVVIGNAVNDVVKSLVENIVTPLIALVTPEGTLQNLQVHVHGSVFKIGLALNSLLSFVCIAFLVYFIAKLILRNEDLLVKK